MIRYPVGSEPEDGPFADVDDLSHAQQGQELRQRPHILGVAHDSFEGYRHILVADQLPLDRELKGTLLDTDGPLHHVADQLPLRFSESITS